MTEIATRPMSETEAAQYRARFPIFEHTTYLNSCSLGPLSREGIAALERYRDDWSRYGAPAWWKEWIPKLREARSRFARLIGAGEHEVTISHSISSALSSIASTFDYRERSTVVVADLDFPTINHQWLAKEHRGVSVRFARSEDRIRVLPAAYEQVMDQSVAHIATSHSFYSTGFIQPVRELADLAHAHGSKIVVDGYHAVGVTPVNVKELDVDFYVGGTLKWLCGGPGLTFIYVREELLAELQPTITGWFAAANQFAFDGLNLDLAPSADRLQLGTPSVATAYTGVAGMDLILEAGTDRIGERIQALTSRVVERAQRGGHAIMSPLDARERGGIVMLRLAKPEQTVEELAARGFTVDYRPGLVRVSPHFYNTTDDVDRLMDAIDELQQQS
ncbi:MAG TPA: aminotransferase class V-fold PLP-dependent enzyme [Chloroflexota bacterium]|nr:aminotransferase class V-fold PLP-dependent enzyme [Chloroflexota bacterium]